MPAPRLYSDLAHWWPLLSPPSEYEEEAADLLPLLEPSDPHQTLLELGSGGGSLAFHLQAHFQLTLTDLSPQMLAVSRALNPACEHIVGDMTSIRLGRLFDRVLIHDAIMYATTESALRSTLETASVHCRPGGLVVAVPDYVKEGFAPTTDCGGHDGLDGRALRYLEWTYDPDPSDSHAEMVFAFLLRSPSGQTRVEQDPHRFGLFPRQIWLDTLEACGLSPRIHSDPWDREVFVCLKR